MPETGQWQASLPEQRTAWGIATCCIVLVFLASVQPQWFDFTTREQPVQQQLTQQPAVQKPIAQKPVVQAPVITQPTARMTPHPTPSPKHAQQVETTVKTHTSQPKSKKISAPPPRPVSNTANIASGFYVQIGAFQRSHARGLADRLKKDGWKTVISARKNDLYAVWIGPKKTRVSAEKLLKTIQRKLKSKGFIVHQKSV